MAFLRCGLLVAAGMVLQMAAGDVPAAFLRYPWSAVAAVNYLYLLVLAFSLSGKYRWLKTLWDEKACISSFVTALAAVILSGFVPIVSTWPFVLVMLYFTTALGIRTVAEASGIWSAAGQRGAFPSMLRHVSRAVMHGGVFLLLFAGIFGNGDKLRCKAVLSPGVPAGMADDGSGTRRALPFTVTLHSFTMDEYPPKLYVLDKESGAMSKRFLYADRAGTSAEVDGWLLRADTCLSMAGCMPGSRIYRAMEHTGAAPAVSVTARRLSDGMEYSGWVSCGSHVFSGSDLDLGDGFAVVMPRPEPEKYLSDVTVADRKGYRERVAIEVNRPARYGSWRIYQAGYDTSRGRWSEVSILEFVYDPWYWLICAALWAVLASAVLMACARWNLKAVLLSAVLFAAVCIGVFYMQIHGRTLVPALQSTWFIPHVAAYMFAYTVLGAAAVAALYLWLRPPHKGSPERGLRLCDALVGTGTAFLSAGMVMGALWAKQAWGDWWTWDPKETWAAATWLGYLLYLHLRASRCTDPQTAFALILFSFLLLQMSWYGVNYLPVAQGASLHVY